MPGNVVEVAFLVKNEHFQRNTIFLGGGRRVVVFTVWMEEILPGMCLYLV